MHPAGFQGTVGNCLAVQVESRVFLQHIFQFSRESFGFRYRTVFFFFYFLLFIFDSQNSEQFKGVKMK